MEPEHIYNYREKERKTVRVLSGGVEGVGKNGEGGNFKSPTSRGDGSSVSINWPHPHPTSLLCDAYADVVAETAQLSIPYFRRVYAPPPSSTFAHSLYTPAEDSHHLSLGSYIYAVVPKKRLHRTTMHRWSPHLLKLLIPVSTPVVARPVAPLEP